MIVYRLCREKHKLDISGRGAELAGGRWNSKGFALLYTSENRALCTTEIAVHIPFGIVPNDYFLITMVIPDPVDFDEINSKELPENWAAFPWHKFTQIIGDTFVMNNKRLILKVPSAVVQGEYNYLISPKHIDFEKVRITKMEPFKFDKRLFRG